MTRVERFDLPDHLYYDPQEHLWLVPTDEGVRVGLDALGVELLGDLVYIAVEPGGRAVRRGEAIGSLEAEKMIRPLLVPVSGTVLAVNEAVLRTPRLVNEDPYGAGWLVLVRPTRWEEERAELLHGAETVRGWLEAEVARLRAEEGQGRDA